MVRISSLRAAAKRRHPRIGAAPAPASGECPPGVPLCRLGCPRHGGRICWAAGLGLLGAFSAPSWREINAPGVERVTPQDPAQSKPASPQHAAALHRQARVFRARRVESATARQERGKEALVHPDGPHEKTWYRIPLLPVHPIFPSEKCASAPRTSRQATSKDTSSRAGRAMNTISSPPGRRSLWRRRISRNRLLARFRWT